ncbi:MAG: hypothetical protein LQ350_003637 [Teloschistes chrysophthalmus]|nr:MAG: hypothetical protein LQ350_003637 [Niorma chrysophthalma]
MPPTSSFVAVVIPVRKQKSFLDLPPEVRIMIYDYALPDVIRVQKQPLFDLAILRASRTIYREAREILKKRDFLSVKIEDRRTHTLALRWIDWLGRRRASTNIRSITIDTCIEVHRTEDEVSFRRCIFRVCTEASMGLLVKFTIPPRSETVTYRYKASAYDSTPMRPVFNVEIPCLASRPPWTNALRKLLYRSFTNMPLYSTVVTIDKSGLKMILDGIIAYSEYYHLWRPLKCWNVEGLAVQEIRHSKGRIPSADSYWDYLNWRPLNEIVDPSEYAE